MYIHPRAAASSNDAAEALEVFGGFPLSGHYQLMPRVLLYLLLFGALWSRTTRFVVMLWTSLAAIHVCALAKNHSSAVLDMDMLPAASATVLGLGFAPAYIRHCRSLRGAGRADIWATCLWMVLLWAGLVSYLASTKFQPLPIPCLNSHQHNITSRPMLSECTFQCHNISTDHPMRIRQNATLITVPSSVGSFNFFTGGKTPSKPVIGCTVLLTLIVLFGFWMATIKSINDRIQEDTAKFGKSSIGGWFFPFKFAMGTFIFVVWFCENALKHLPGTEKKDTIGQWGPLVAFALAVIGLLLRWTVGKLHLNGEEKSSVIEVPRQQHGDGTDLIKHEVDTGVAQTTATTDRSAASDVTLPEVVHVRDAATNGESDSKEQVIARF